MTFTNTIKYGLVFTKSYPGKFVYLNQTWSDLSPVDDVHSAWLSNTDEAPVKLADKYFEDTGERLLLIEVSTIIREV